MNKEEAKIILLNHFMPYRKWPYAKLQSLVGGEHVSKITGTSGTEYFFQVYVAPVNECDTTLCVEGYVFEVGARMMLPPNEHSEFYVTADGIVS